MPYRLLAFLGCLSLVLLAPIFAQEKSAEPVILATLKGHTDAVYAVAYSPDGKYIVTASFDHTLKLWDAATGKEVKTYGGTAGHTKQVISVGFSPDGSMIASGSTDNTLKVWDVPVNAPVRSLKTKDGVHAVALSPDGLKLAIGGNDGSLKLVAPGDFKELVQFEAGHQGAITKLAFTANGQTLASVGTDRTLRYWDAAKGKLLATVGAHTAAVNNIVVHPNNTATYTVGDDGFLKFWAMPAATSKTLPGHTASIQALALTADGAGYYTGGDDRTVRQFALAQPKELRVLTGPQASVTSVATHPANAFIAAGTADSRIFLWNNADAKVHNHWLAHTGAVHSVQIVAPGQQLMSAGADGLVKFWALPSVPPRTLTHPDAVLAAVASGDGKKLFTGSKDKLVRIWDTTKQALEKQFAGHTGPVTAVAISPNLQILASGSEDHTIRLWNQATAKESDLLVAHTAPLTSLAINASNTQMLSASEDGAVKLWQLPLIAPKAMMHPDQITALILTADSNKLLTASNDKIVRLWNLTNGVKERDFAGAALPIVSIAVSNNSATIAASSADKMVTLWNSADAKVLHKLPMPALAQALVFSPDGQSIYIGLADNRVKQIKVADGKEIKTLPASHKGAISGLALAPQGDLLYSASADKSILASALPDGTVKRKFDHVAPISAMTLSKDGTRLAAVADKLVKVWLAADGKELAALKLPADAKSISLSPDNTRVIVGGADKLARVFDLDGRLLEMLPHDGAVNAVAFVNAKRVVTGGADKLARLWTSPLLWQRQHQGPVRQAVFTPKGDQVVSASDDKTIKIWNAADGKELKSFTNESPLTHLTLNGDASKIATASPLAPPLGKGGPGGGIKIWNVADGKAILTLPTSTPVQGLAFSPNGQRLAIAAQDGPSNLIRVHDIALGKEVQTFAEHTGAIRTLQYLADGRTLVSASLDKTARLLDVGVVSALAAHPAGATFTQYNGNGTQVLTAGADKIVKLWDLPKAAVVKSFGPVADPIKAITFNKDFARVAVTTGKNAKVWTVGDGKEIATLPHAAEVLSLSFSPDNTRIVTGSLDKQTRLWDLATGKEMQFFAQDDAVAAVQHLANNVIVSAAGKVTRIDTASIVKQIAADAGPVHALTIVPVNTHLITGGADKIVKLWNIANGNKEREFVGSAAAIRSAAISKNGLLLAAGSADALVRVYQFADGKEIGSVKTAGEVRALGFAPNNLALVGSSLGRTLEAWAVPFTAGQPIPKDFLSPAQTWTTAGLIDDFAVAADNATIFSAGQDKAVHVWKLASPNPTRSFALGNNVDAVAFQPNGNLLASGAHDGKVKLFDLIKNAQVKDITAHVSVINKNNVPQPIYSLTFTPDGKQFLTSSFDSSLKLWDTANANMVREFKAHKEKEFDRGHQEPVYTAAFSPDGKFIASGSSGLERVIKIWSIDGKVVRDLANPHYPSSPPFPAASHPGAVTNLRFTKDGKRLLSVGDAPGNKGFLAVWDWQAGKLLYSSTLPHGVYYGLAIAPDENTFVVTSGNRDRKGASPDFNAAYLMKMPVK